MSEAATEAVEAEYVSQTTTPSGVEIRYAVKPKRKYEVRHVWNTDGKAQVVHKEEGWKEVPSVTTVLGVLDKPGLPWWGMKTGVEGTLELHKRGILREARLIEAGQMNGQKILAVPGEIGFGLVTAGVDEVLAHLTAQQLTVNHQRDRAGSRGNAVHDAFELWAREGTRPTPDMFPPEERGYVEGLCSFLEDVDPEPLAAEVMVGSVEHGFAGRYDVRLRINKECQVVYKRTPKRGAHYATLKPGVILGDLKTSSGIYPKSHYRQLEAYELASVECGYEPTDARGVIHVSADGGYEFVRSTATAEDFLCVLAVWRSDESLTRRVK